MDILRVKENGVWRDIPAIVGPEGPQGQTGPAGAPGQGVPSGGSAGDVLVKKTGTDYDTEWSDDLSDLKSAMDDKIDAPATPGTSGQVLTSDGQGGQSWQTPSGGDVMDVQVNGVSVVGQGGVANVPIAGENTFGALKVYNGTHGLGVWDTGVLHTDPASDAQIRAGNNAYKCVNTDSQHKSVFYGLAKVAGSDMASSSNPVGQYTDAAKVAIQKMLGIYEAPWELIRDITLTERTNIDITVDSNGLPLNLLSIFIEVMYAENLESESAGYGRYLFYDSNNAYIYTETGKYTTNANLTYKDIYISKKGNATFGFFTRQVTTGNFGTWYSKSILNSGSSFALGNIVRIKLKDNDYEPAGTKITIYAQKAY